MQQPPPVEDGTWETAIAFIRNFEDMTRVFQWLNSGQHPFRGCSLDSLTEIQKRCLDAIAGTNQPTQQDWGALLRQMEGLVRQFRDLTMHPTKPLEAVVFVTTTQVDDKGWTRPHVQGQLRLTLPYFVDVVGYMFATADPNGGLQRQLMVQPYQQYVCKDRTARLQPIIANPNIERMLEDIYGNQLVG